MSSNEYEKIIAALIGTGLTRTESEEVFQNLTKAEATSLINEGDITSSNVEKKTDGLVNALILAGFVLPVANAIVQVLGDDEEVVRLIMAGEEPLIFMTQQDSKVDDKICLPKQGETWAKSDPSRPRIPFQLHPHCLLPETLTNLPDDDIISAMRSRYTGLVIEIFTAHGSCLTVTPNHLLLTPQGFVAADFLRKGDKIINSLNTQRPPLGIHPNNHRKPTTIKQVFDSLTESLSMNTTSMPSSPEYFHSDAISCHGNIDIVWTNSLLRNTGNTSLLKRLFTKFLNRCNSYLSFLSCKRTLAFFLQSFLSSSDCIMSGTRKTSSFFRGRLRHTQIHGCTSASGCNTILLEVFNDVHTTTLENLRKSLDRFSSIVQLDEIININVKSYSGFVYDIQTKSTLYSGNGIILSNCRCFWQDPITGRNLGQF